MYFKSTLNIDLIHCVGNVSRGQVTISQIIPFSSKFSSIGDLISSESNLLVNENLGFYIWTKIKENYKVVTSVRDLHLSLPKSGHSHEHSYYKKKLIYFLFLHQKVWINSLKLYPTFWLPLSTTFLRLDINDGEQ